MEVGPVFRSLRRWSDQLGLPLAALGLGAVAWHNWRQWRADRALLAQARGVARPDFAQWPEQPLVSVLVAAWNEAELIERHIASFKALRYPHKELVLCAGGDDGTYELALRHAGPALKVLRQERGEGKQRALRRCLEQSMGSILYLTDADCVLDDESFLRTLEPLMLDGEEATTGRFAPLKGQRAHPFVQMQWFVDTYARSHNPLYVQGLIGRNAAIRRETLACTGSFASDVAIGTDYFLAMQLVRQGSRIRYVHDSMVATEYLVSPASYVRQQSRWLRNILLHGSRFSAEGQVLDALRQCLTGSAVVLWPLSWPLTGRAGIALWLVVIAQGSVARLRYIQFSARALGEQPAPGVRLNAPLLLLLDQAMLCYTLVEWAVPKLRKAW